MSTNDPNQTPNPYGQPAPEQGHPQGAPQAGTYGAPQPNQQQQQAYGSQQPNQQQQQAYGSQQPLGGYGQQAYGMGPGPFGDPAGVTNTIFLNRLLCLIGQFFACSWIVALVFYFVDRDKSPVHRQEAAEELNFQITLLIGYVISAILLVVAVGFFTLGAIAICAIVFNLLSALAANRGQTYRYPLTIRMVS